MQKLEHPYKPISSYSISKADAIVVLSGVLKKKQDLLIRRVQRTQKMHAAFAVECASSKEKARD